MRVVLVSAMGFRESTRAVTGTETVWQHARRESSKDVWILPPFEWDADAKSIAALIMRNTPMNASIIVNAYSWGCGQFFIGLANELLKNDRFIAHAILCDPVYRSRFVPTWLPLNPLSLTRFPKLHVPPNVMEVDWLYQRNSRPWGHTPVWRDRPWFAGAAIHPGVQIANTNHTEIDNSVVYQNMVLKSLYTCSKGAPS